MWFIKRCEKRAAGAYFRITSFNAMKKTVKTIANLNEAFARLMLSGSFTLLSCAFFTANLSSKKSFMVKPIAIIVVKKMTVIIIYSVIGGFPSINQLISICIYKIYLLLI